MIKKIKVEDGRKYNKGRPRRTEPNDRDKHILEALREGHRMAEVGRVYDLSRQYILQIRQRWPELAPKVQPVLHNKHNGGKKNGTNTTLRGRRSTVPTTQRV